VTKRKRRPTPQKPPVRGRIVEPAKPPVPKPPPPRRDPATVIGIRSAIYCPDCRTELLHDVAAFGTLACPGCGLGYWMRGAELVREGEVEAIETPSTQLPRAQAKVRKSDD
jgi:hypothetical protein